VFDPEGDTTGTLEDAGRVAGARRLGSAITMEWIFLVLMLVCSWAGLGVVLVNRVRMRSVAAAPGPTGGPPRTAPTPPPRARPAAPAAPEAVELESRPGSAVVEPELEEAGVRARRG